MDYNTQNMNDMGVNRGDYVNRHGNNLQYHAGGEMGQSGGQKAKLYQMFNMEVRGFENYMKLAKKNPEYAEEFIELALTEQKEAETVFEIYQRMQENSQEYGSSSRLLESMNREISKMEEKIEKANF